MLQSKGDSLGFRHFERCDKKTPESNQQKKQKTSKTIANFRFQ